MARRHGAVPYRCQHEWAELEQAQADINALGLWKFLFDNKWLTPPSTTEDLDAWVQRGVTIADPADAPLRRNYVVGSYAAYRNIVLADAAFEPHKLTDEQIEQVRMYMNPYREWIGAQIRGDIWGWVCPGDPRAAARLAFNDACVSHVRNGIYGEMFVAGMIAGACSVTEPRDAVEAGLCCIPQESRLAEAVRTALALPSKAPTWEGALDLLEGKYGRYHWVHSINNAALVAAMPPPQ
jgi:hypothetical protein